MGQAFRPRMGQSRPETQELQPPKHLGEISSFQQRSLIKPSVNWLQNRQYFLLCLHYCLCQVRLCICALAAVGFKRTLDFEYNLQETWQPVRSTWAMNTAVYGWPPLCHKHASLYQCYSLKHSVLYPVRLVTPESKCWKLKLNRTKGLWSIWGWTKTLKPFPPGCLQVVRV